MGSFLFLVLEFPWFSLALGPAPEAGPVGNHVGFQRNTVWEVLRFLQVAAVVPLEVRDSLFREKWKMGDGHLAVSLESIRSYLRALNH